MPRNQIYQGITLLARNKPYHVDVADDFFGGNGGDEEDGDDNNKHNYLEPTMLLMKGIEAMKKAARSL